nr:reverse transcriptase domain-containing protein [Tanacetum cinerariifolium]
SANYNDMTAKQIDAIGMACEEYSQEVLSFSDVIASSNPTPYYDLIVSTTSLTLTPFRNSDFFLKKLMHFLLSKMILLHQKLIILLKKLPKKLGDPSKFLISCDFPGKAQCLALADLSASINLMPFYVWNKLSLLDLTPTCTTLELVDRSISHPVMVAEDVYVKVGSFHFSANFVVVDFDADPRVPIILKTSFLKTERALIYVFKGELTLRVGKEAITFNLDQTLRYSANYNDMTAKRIDIIDMA